MDVKRDWAREEEREVVKEVVWASMRSARTAGEAGSGRARAKAREDEEGEVFVW